METIYQSVNKNGTPRDFKREFTTRERANADVFFNNRVQGIIVEKLVSMREFNILSEGEREEDFYSYNLGVITNYERYKQLTISEEYISKVKSHKKNIWHDMAWVDFTRTKKYTAVSYAFRLIGENSDYIEIKKIAEDFMISMYY